jgi:hypothetical protein
MLAVQQVPTTKAAAACQLTQAPTLVGSHFRHPPQHAGHQGVAHALPRRRPVAASAQEGGGGGAAVLVDDLRRLPALRCCVGQRL